MGTFIDTEDRLDVLINNAGVFDMSNKYVFTEDSYEQHHGTNFLAPSLLSLLLVSKMLETKTMEGCNGREAIEQSNCVCEFKIARICDKIRDAKEIIWVFREEGVRE